MFRLRQCRFPALLGGVLCLAATPMLGQAGISWSPLSATEVSRTLALNSPDNHARYEALKKLFEVAGCRQSALREIKVPHAQEPDLLCTLPGAQTPADGRDAHRVLVVARYDHAGKGSGVIDNWSGAAMLPLLYTSVLPGYREHTMQFAAVSGPQGLVKLMKSLSAQEKESSVALVDLRDLGMGPMRMAMLYQNTANENSSMLGRDVQGAIVTKAMRDTVAAAHSAATASSAFSNAEGPGEQDPRVFAMKATTMLMHLDAPVLGNPYVESFMAAKPQMARDEAEEILASGIPGVVIHSVTKDDAAVPDSPADVPERIDQQAYYAAYSYTAVYLMILDHPQGIFAASRPR